MKMALVDMKNGALYSVLFATLLLLSGCAVEQPVIEDERIQDVMTEESESVLQTTDDSEKETASTLEKELVIYRGNILPDRIQVSSGDSITLILTNTLDSIQRVDIPFYGSQVSTDVPPLGYDVVTFTPTARGLVGIELNGAIVGHVLVE